MFEIKSNKTYADAIERAHAERSAAFHELFHEITHFFQNLRFVSFKHS